MCPVGDEGPGKANESTGVASDAMDHLPEAAKEGADAFEEVSAPEGKENHPQQE